MILDKLVEALDFEKLSADAKLDVRFYDFERTYYYDWVMSFKPKLLKTHADWRIKKLLEYFTSTHLLELKSTDVVMDVGGGVDGFIGALDCGRKIL